MSDETKKKISRNHPLLGMTGEKHPLWKGGKLKRQDRRRVYRDCRQEKSAGRKKSELCEVCESSDVVICFDHDHQTGKFRGWLCRKCNAALGLVDDDVLILKKLIVYLKRSKKPLQT